MKIYITRQVPQVGLDRITAAGHELTVQPEDRVLSKQELIAELQQGEYNAVLCELTDKIDDEVFVAAGEQCKIFANYAVGYDNIDVAAAAKRNIIITNTPGVLTETVAEHTVALLLSIARRIPEADRFTRAGKYESWAPMLLLGSDIAGKTVGVIGAGRIGSRVGEILKQGFGANIIYNNPKPEPRFEEVTDGQYYESVDQVLAEADFVTLHVPLLDSTRHLVNSDNLQKMKSSAYLINTSRGPVVDETALATALQNGTIRGAALDVFEEEPKVHPGLLQLENVILTPHIASATEETRGKMAEIAADNIISVLDGKDPLNPVSK